MKLDADSVKKINKLAATLRNTGLASSTTEAVEKAKEIVLGIDYGPASLEEVEQDVDSVEKDLQEDLTKNGIYFANGDEPEKAEEESPTDPEVQEEIARLKEIVDEPMEEEPEVVPKKKQHVNLEEEEPTVEPDLMEEEEKEEDGKEQNKDSDDNHVMIEAPIEEDKGGIQIYETDEPPKEPEKDEYSEEFDQDHPAYDVSKEDKTVDELLAEEQKQKKHDAKADKEDEEK